MKEAVFQETFFPLFGSTGRILRPEAAENLSQRDFSGCRLDPPEKGNKGRKRAENARNGRCRKARPLITPLLLPPSCGSPIFAYTDLNLAFPGLKRNTLVHLQRYPLFAERVYNVAMCTCLGLLLLSRFPLTLVVAWLVLCLSVALVLSSDTIIEVGALLLSLGSFR